jgi:hypothetical protein
MKRILPLEFDLAAVKVISRTVMGYGDVVGRGFSTDDRGILHAYTEQS